jgi:predicted TIM-barrel enzyme
MSYSAEVAMIGLASRMGMIAMPYVFSAEEAAAMAEAGPVG